MIQAVFAYMLIAGFFGIEVFLRQGAPARSLEKTDADKGSTTLIGASLGAAFALPLLLNLLQVGRMPASIVSWLGLAIMLLGLGLRVWSMHVLGAYFSRTLRVADAQVIVTQGPYRVVRHPGYTGTILLWIGSGLALTNWLATAIVALLLLAVYSYRIRMEEAMLLTTFGEGYRQYRRHTWKLLPFLY